jgi:hypothetical protein
VCTCTACRVTLTKKPASWCRHLFCLRSIVYLFFKTYFSGRVRLSSVDSSSINGVRGSGSSPLNAPSTPTTLPATTTKPQLVASTTTTTTATTTKLSPHVVVPSWREVSLKKSYKLEGTENTSEDVYLKRHVKYENEEIKIKRWDMRRQREEFERNKLLKRHQSLVSFSFSSSSSSSSIKNTSKVANQQQQQQQQAEACVNLNYTITSVHASSSASSKSASNQKIVFRKFDKAQLEGTHSSVRVCVCVWL